MREREREHIEDLQRSSRLASVPGQIRDHAGRISISDRVQSIDITL
jgi:hypothetical protein